MIEIITSQPELTGAVNRHYALRATQLAKFEPWRQFFDAAFDHASPVQRLAEYGEILWAARAEHAAEDRELVAQIGHFCATYSLFSYHRDERGFRMMAAMRREAGEPGAEQDPALDPETDPRFGGSTEEEPEPEPDPA